MTALYEAAPPSDPPPCVHDAGCGHYSNPVIVLYDDADPRFAAYVEAWEEFPRRWYAVNWSGDIDDPRGWLRRVGSGEPG